MPGEAGIRVSLSSLFFLVVAVSVGSQSQSKASGVPRTGEGELVWWDLNGGLMYTLLHRGEGNTLTPRDSGCQRRVSESCKNRNCSGAKVGRKPFSLQTPFFHPAVFRVWRLTAFLVDREGRRG